MTFWTADKTAELIKLRSEGLSFAKLGRALGCTRNAVLSKVHRLDRKPVPRAAGPQPTRKSHMWNDRSLTETWADRKARRAAERAA